MSAVCFFFFDFALLTVDSFHNKQFFVNTDSTIMGVRWGHFSMSAAMKNRWFLGSFWGAILHEFVYFSESIFRICFDVKLV